MCVKNKKSNAVRVFSLSCNRRAVLTIETAIVLPMFTIAMMTLISIMSIYYVGCKIEAALSQEAEYVSVTTFDNNAYSVSGIKANIVYKLGNKLLSCGLIEGGESGLDFSETDLTNEEIIILDVKYNVKLPFDIFGSYSIPCEKRIIVHSWIGYINGLNGASDSFQYVYITNNGSVYHRSRECSHISLSVKKIKGEEVPSLRNIHGEKYKRCMSCRPKSVDEILFITTDGDKYHNSLTCSGLKRTVRRVRLSEIGGIPPCSRCGH